MGLVGMWVRTWRGRAVRDGRRRKQIMGDLSSDRGLDLRVRGS